MSAEIDVGVAAIVRAAVGDTMASLLKPDKRPRGLQRSIPVMPSSNYTNNVLVADRPQSGRVWVVRSLSIWSVSPLAAQAGLVAVHVGSSPDSASVGSAINSECVIPALTLPVFQTISPNVIAFRNRESLYVVPTAAVVLPYFLAMTVLEYAEDEYTYVLGED